MNQEQKKRRVEIGYEKKQHGNKKTKKKLNEVTKIKSIREKERRKTNER